MKRGNKIIIGVIIFSATLALVVLLSFWEGIRDNKTDAYIHSLSKWIELYQRSENFYPHSLLDLPLNHELDENSKQSVKNLLNEIQHNPWHDNYDYNPSTNGFTIIVTGPAPPPEGWFGKQRRIEKYFAIGDAFKQ